MSSHLLGRRPWLLSGLTSLSALLISSEAPSPSSSSSFSSSSSSFLSPLIEVSRVQDEEEEKKKSNGEGENKKKKSPLFSLSSRERRSLDTFADISHPQRENQTPLFLLQSRANDEGSLRSFRSSTSFCPTPSSSWILSFFPSFLSPSSFIFSPLLSPSSSCSSLSSLERHLPPIERASSSSLSSPSGVRSDRSLASQGENKEGGEEGERGEEEEKQPDILRRYRRVGTFTSPVGKWSMSFNVFPSTSTRYVYVHQSSHSMALCDGINGAHAAAFVAQHFLHSSSRSSSSCSFSSCCSSSSPCSSSSCCTSTSKRVSPNSPSSASTSPLSSSPSPPSTLSFSSSPSSTSPSTTPDESLCEEEKEGERCLARDRKCSLGKEREEDSFCCRSLSPQSQEKRCVGGKSPGESSEHEEKKKKNGCDISPGMALQTDRREPRETNHEMCAADEETHSEEKKEKIGEKEKENKKKKTSGEMLSKGEGADRRSHKDDKKKGEGEEEKREEEETEMDFGFFVARKAGRKYQRKLKEKEKEEKKEKKDDEEEEAKEEGVKKKKKLREEEEESFSEVLLKNLQEMKHSHMVKECNLHFRNLEQEYLNACNGDPRLLAEGCSIGAAFSTPSGLLICTLGDVGAVLAVREGQHALDRLNARENKSSSSSSISTIDKNASSGSPSSSSSLLKRKNFSAGSKGGAEEEEEKERRIPLVAWRLSDLHNTENANEMRRIRRSHPNESTQDLLDSRQLLKGVTHATRGLGAFHLKAPEINNLLPEEKRVKNFLPAQSSRQPSPYLSSELDYMLQPFHPDVEALIIGSSGFWQVFSPEEAVALVDQFLLTKKKRHTQHEEKKKEEEEGGIYSRRSERLRSSGPRGGPIEKSEKGSSSTTISSSISSSSSSRSKQELDDAASYLLQAALVELHKRTSSEISFSQDKKKNLIQRAIDVAGLQHWEKNTKKRKEEEDRHCQTDRKKSGGRFSSSFHREGEEEGASQTKIVQQLHAVYESRGDEARREKGRGKGVFLPFSARQRALQSSSLLSDDVAVCVIVREKEEEEALRQEE